METVRKITKESSREDPFHDNILTKPEVNAKDRNEARGIATPDIVRRSTS